MDSVRPVSHPPESTLCFIGTTKPLTLRNSLVRRKVLLGAEEDEEHSEEYPSTGLALFLSICLSACLAKIECCTLRKQ